MKEQNQVWAFGFMKITFQMCLRLNTYYCSVKKEQCDPIMFYDIHYQQLSVYLNSLWKKMNNMPNCCFCDK